MKQLADFIKQGKNFAVISHISPDGDTMAVPPPFFMPLKSLGSAPSGFVRGTFPRLL